jgi:hypothetical protein
MNSRKFGYRILHKRSLSSARLPPVGLRVPGLGVYMLWCCIFMRPPAYARALPRS